MIEMVLPQFGMGMADGTITIWHKAVGDTVQQGEPLCDVEAAKTTVEVGAPCDGVLQQILVPSGTNVPVNTVIAVIGAVGEAAAPAAPTAPAPAPVLAPAQATLPVLAAPPPAQAAFPDRQGKGPQIEPRARRAARERGLDLATIIGSGPDGRIIEEDVLRAAAPDAPPLHTAPALPPALAAAVPASQPLLTDAVYQTWRVPCDGQPLARLLDAIALPSGTRIPLRSVLIKAAAIALADAGLAAWPVLARTEDGLLLAPANPARLSASAIEAALVPADAVAPCLVVEPVAEMGLEHARFDAACAASLSASTALDGAISLALVVAGSTMPPVAAKGFLAALRGHLENPLAALA